VVVQLEPHAFLTENDLATASGEQECMQLLVAGKGCTNPNTITNNSLHTRCLFLNSK
jgi:hypothetical protein